MALRTGLPWASMAHRPSPWAEMPKATTSGQIASLFALSFRMTFFATSHTSFMSISDAPEKGINTCAGSFWISANLPSREIRPALMLVVPASITRKYCMLTSYFLYSYSSVSPLR